MADNHNPQTKRRGSTSSFESRLPSASAAEWGRRGLGGGLRRIALAAAEGFLCDRDQAGELVSPGPATCGRVVDDFGLSVGAGSGPVRLGVGALLVAVDLLPIAVVGRMRRMSHLPLAERVRYLQAMEEHRVGLFVMMLVGLKIPLTLSAFEDGDGLRMTGFDRPTMAAARCGAGAEHRKPHRGSGTAASSPVGREEDP